MNLGIWLIPVLAGYSVLRFSHYWKRSFTSTAGYEFFFGAALAGGLLLIVARLVTRIGEAMGVGTTALWMCWKEYADFDHSGTLAMVILLALVLICGMNMTITEQDAASRWVEKNESRIGWILRMSLEKSWLVEISMKTRKSYVGYVIRMPGQRDPHPGDVAFRDPHEHLVVLPMTNVMSVCRFDPEVYAATERS